MPDVKYRWFIEELDHEGDVLDVGYEDTYEQLMKLSRSLKFDYAVGVARRTVGLFDGATLDQSYAYIQDNGHLPRTFSHADKTDTFIDVPPQFFEEVRLWNETGAVLSNGN